MDRKVDSGVLLLLFCFVPPPPFSSSSSCRRFDRRRPRQALYSIGRPSDPTSRPRRRGKYGRMLSTTGQHRSDEYSIHSHRNDDDDDDDENGDDENGEGGRDLPDVWMARITPRLRASTNCSGSSGVLADDDDDDDDGGAEVVADDDDDDDDDDDGRAIIIYFFGLGGLIYSL